MEIKKRSTWPWVIGGIYVVFMLAMMAVLAYSTTQSVDLVAPDYYAKTLTYQEQIQRINNSAELSSPIKLTQSRASLTLTLPQELLDKKLQGMVTLFRPSDANRDIRVPLSCDAQGRQYLPISELSPGMWRVKVTFNDGRKEYYFEEAVVL